jgi:inosine/xanthosine triphosphate pyrophosphatase family protein
VRILLATGNPGKLEEARQMLLDTEIQRLEADTVEPQKKSLSETSGYKWEDGRRERRGRLWFCRSR